MERPVRAENSYLDIPQSSFSSSTADLDHDLAFVEDASTSSLAPVPVTKLPVELVDRVFELIPPSGRRRGLLLPDVQSLLSSALVCRAWHGPAVRRLYHTVRVPNDSFSKAAGVIDALRADGALVRALVFEPSGWAWEGQACEGASLIADVVFTCLSLTPNVRHVSISSPSSVSHTEFEATLASLGALPRLQALEWTRTHFPHFSLAHLRITTTFNMAHIQRIAQCLPRLTSVHLAPILHPAFLSHPMPEWHRLTSMVLDESSMQDEDFYNLLCNQAQLERLDIGFRSLTQAGIASALHCVKDTLVELRLAGYIKRPPGSPRRAIQSVLSDFAVLQSMRTNLHHSAFGIGALANHPPHLRSWLSWDVLSGVGPNCLRAFILSLNTTEEDKVDFVFTIDPELWRGDERRESLERLESTCEAKGLFLTISEGDVTVRRI